MSAPRHSDTRRRPLHEAQRRFLDDLLGRRRRTAAQRRSAFRTPQRSGIESRWHVYAHGFAARITEALEGEYVAVRRILGEAAFGRLIERYLEVFPPRSYDLAHAGDRLPRFLEYDGRTQELPFLPDLALLERRVAEAFVAADARPLGWPELQALSAQDAARLPLALAPGVAVVRSEWPLHDLWLCRTRSEDAEVQIPVEGRPQMVLVHRRGTTVGCDAIEETSAQLVEAAGFGDATLEDLRELVAPEPDEAGIHRLLANFQQLVSMGVFVVRRHTGSTGVIEIEGEHS